MTELTDFLLTAATRKPKLRGIIPEQHSVTTFQELGFIAFHRHSDGLPVAIARTRTFVRPPEGTYPVPLPLGDVSLYRCTLPEITA